ncbi:substrate-binding domain-containing protein [Streptomyces sp. NBC_01518]|uniref:substrate-binding domain-containing protein n=1 Tax=Streptomyces sp. NBC_01518 TaxID=2903891 RepID=UPI003869E9C0
MPDDSMALGVLRALRESGVRVPGEMDVVGFDGVESADFGVSRLTSVSPDKREIPRTAVSLLLNRIDAADSGVPCRDAVIGQRIVVRERSGG